MNKDTTRFVQAIGFVIGMFAWVVTPFLVWAMFYSFGFSPTLNRESIVATWMLLMCLAIIAARTFNHVLRTANAGREQQLKEEIQRLTVELSKAHSGLN